MMASLQKRWIVTASIWAVAVGLTFWNTGRIQEVSATREDSERLRKELTFARRHAAQLDAVQQRHATLFLPVESPKLGALIIQGEIETLAAALDLNAITVNCQVDQTAANRMPLSLTARGSLANVVQFLSALQQYPYLTMRRAQIRMRFAEGMAEVEGNLWFRFAKSPQEAGAGNLVQGIMRRPSAG